MNRLNLSVFRKFFAIAKLYWLGIEKKGAFTLLGILGILLIAHTQLSVLLNQTQGEVISTLAAEDGDLFWETVRKFFLILIAYVPLLASYYFTQDKLQIIF